MRSNNVTAKTIYALALLSSAAVPLSLPGLSASASAAARTASAFKIDRQRLAGLPNFIDGVLAQQLDNREVAGAVVSVVSDGKIIFSRGYGFADVDKGIPADPARSLFRPGSSSKLFTWTALMQLVEQGRVDLDAPVSQYIDFKIPDTQTRPILVRHLLDHTPGFEDRGGIRVDSPSEFVPLGKWLAQNIPTRVREPGIETSYSNYGTALAGYIVERVSGEPFPDYVERHIFKPLGMNRTTFREPLPAALAPDMAVGYDYVDGRFVAKPFEYFHNIMPAGSGSSTAEDMARFMLAHLQEGRVGRTRILKPETARLMHSNLSANASPLPGFAHGFYVVREQGPRMIGHGGNTVDFHSMLLTAPDADFGIFVSYTGGAIGSTQARTELINAVVGRLFPEAAAPQFAGPASPSPAGSYRTNRRTYSEPGNPKNDIKVLPQGERGLIVEAAGRKSYWAQIGPSLYQRVTGARAGGPHERILFYGDKSDPKMSFSSQPMNLYRLVSGPETASDAGLGTGSGSVASQRPISANDPRLKAAVDRFAAEVLRDKSTAGLAVGIAEKGQIRLAAGYGVADLESGTPVTERTVFRIGSVTKEFTAAAVLLLAERGKLSIDDPIQKYFPGFPRGGEVTIRHLLTHTSGIHNYTAIADFMPVASRQDRSTAEMVSYIAAAKPLYDFEPGTGWNYSNSGYLMLGAIIEKVSGLRFDEFLQANILDPLGLKDTKVDDLAQVVPDRAEGYEKSKDAPSGFANAGFISMSAAAAAGAMRSTVSDLLKWHEALLGGKLLKPQSVAMMTAPGRLKDGRVSSLGRSAARPEQAPPSEYGFGISTSQRSGRRSVGHGGAIHGFNAWLNSFPDDGVTIVLLTNTSGGSNATAPKLVDAVFGAGGRSQADPPWASSCS
jgi:CubicO group peptidase (beta-lactamase class C family)